MSHSLLWRHIVLLTVGVYSSNHWGLLTIGFSITRFQTSIFSVRPSVCLSVCNANKNGYSEVGWFRTVYDFGHKSQTYIFVLLNTHFSTNCWKLGLVLKVILSSVWWYILTPDSVKCVFNRKIDWFLIYVWSRTLSEVASLLGTPPLLIVE